jgi:hypothetical protein
MNAVIKTDPNSSKHVFICYSHRDTTVVEEEAAWLRRQGFTLWYDDNIAAGHAWSEELACAITDASAILYFLSPHSVSSAYCMDELHFAKDQGCPIVPIEIKPVTLSPGLRLTLGTKQFVKMSELNRKDFRNKLAGGLSAIIVARHKKTAANTPTEMISAAIMPALTKARGLGAVAALITLSIVFMIA